LKISCPRAGQPRALYFHGTICTHANNINEHVFTEITDIGAVFTPLSRITFAMVSIICAHDRPTIVIRNGQGKYPSPPPQSPLVARKPHGRRSFRVRTLKQRSIRFYFSSDRVCAWKRVYDDVYSRGVHSSRLTGADTKRRTRLL